MSKTLKTIQTIAKVFKIICTVAFILFIVGAIAALLGFIALSAISAADPVIDGQSVVKMISDNARIPMSEMALYCVIGVLSCSAMAIVTYKEKNYLKHEIEDGTPFTLRGAKELFRLGIFTIVVSIVLAIVVGVVVSLFNQITTLNVKVNVLSVEIGTGIAFLFGSLIFKYGAELEAKKRSN